MHQLKATKTPKALLQGTDHLLILTPKARVSKGGAGWPEGLPPEWVEQAQALADDLSPGAMGASASTLTGAKPKRLTVAVLPDEVSRHNAPSRAEAMRRACSQLTGGKSAVLFLLDEEAHLLPAWNALSRTLGLTNYATGASKPKVIKVAAVDGDGAPLSIPKRVVEVGESTALAASWVDRAPTEFAPEAFAKEARRCLAGLPNVTLREIKGDALLKQGLGGIHAVGRTALSAPRMFVATLAPKKRGGKHIALVGKGITYDTGGLSLKISGHMVGMKADMGGAAACLGAFRALARCGSPHKVTLILCLAENAIGPAAVKPDDVITMHSKKTVEVNNTDAEGRLVLADGVSWAARVAKADTIFDAATLTGAQLVATGLLHAAVVSNREELEKLAFESGRASGDLTHPLPFAPEFYRSEFKSAVADMRNSVKNRMNAQSSCAGEFIHWHLEGTDAAWCHVDLAGPAMPSDRATGFGVALLEECVRSLGS